MEYPLKKDDEVELLHKKEREEAKLKKLREEQEKRERDAAKMRELNNLVQVGPA